MRRRCLLLGVVLLLLGLPLAGETRVKLSALPERAKVFVNLESAEGGAIVQETRRLPLEKGVNDIDFSWQSVRLDPESVRMLLPDDVDGLELLSVSYPGDNRALVWHLHSESARSVEVTIRYRLFGMDMETDYRADVTADETMLTLEEQLILFNQSGENFSGAWLGLGEGNWLKRNWPSGETKKLSVYRVESIPFEKTYTYDVRDLPRDPDDLVRTKEIPVHYRFANKPAYNLSDKPLKPGKLRLFQTGPEGSEVFTGEDQIPYVPIGDSIAVNIGNTRDLRVKQNTVNRQRLNVVRDDGGHVEMYDLREDVEIKVRNFRKHDLELRVIESFEGEWELQSSSHDYTKLSNRTVLFRVPVAAEGQSTLNFRVINRHLGRELQ